MEAKDQTKNKFTKLRFQTGLTKFGWLVIFINIGLHLVAYLIQNILSMLIIMAVPFYSFLIFAVIGIILSLLSPVDLANKASRANQVSMLSLSILLILSQAGAYYFYDEIISTTLNFAIWLGGTSLILFFLSKTVKSSHSLVNLRPQEKKKLVYYLTWPAYLPLFFCLLGFGLRQMLQSEIGLGQPNLAYSLLYFYRFVDIFNYIILTFVAYQAYLSHRQGLTRLFKYRSAQTLLLVLSKLMILLDKAFGSTSYVNLLILTFLIYFLVAGLAFLSGRLENKDRPN